MTREIIADSNSPTYNIAKWLADEWLKIEPNNGKYAVKNFQEVIYRLQNVPPLSEDDCLVFQDVKALFPNTSVKEAPAKFEEWFYSLVVLWN